MRSSVSYRAASAAHVASEITDTALRLFAERGFDAFMMSQQGKKAL